MSDQPKPAPGQTWRFADDWRWAGRSSQRFTLIGRDEKQKGWRFGDRPEQVFVDSRFEDGTLTFVPADGEKHSPAPWHVAAGAVWSAEGLLIASQGSTLLFTQWEANARLIAAAPELAALLREDAAADPIICENVYRGPVIGSGDRIIEEVPEYIKAGQRVLMERMACGTCLACRRRALLAKIDGGTP